MNKRKNRRKKTKGQKNLYWAVKLVMSVASQIADTQERRDFLSSVQVFDEKGKEISIFLKRLGEN